MTNHQEYYQQISDFEYLGNTGIDYLKALFIISGSILLIYGIKLTIIARINKYMDRTEEIERIEIFMENIDKFINLKFTVFLALYLGSIILSLPKYLDLAINFFVFFLVTWVVIKSLFNLVESLTQYQIARNKESKHLVEFFRLIAKISIFLIFSLWFLNSIGIDITAYIAGLSVLGLAVAFALQNIIADLFASVMLYFDRPFEVGDSIKVGSDSGSVEKIGLRSTHLRAPTGNLLVIPNRDLSTKRINNFKNMSERRITQTISISLDTDIKKLEKLPKQIEDIIKKVENTRFLRTFFTNIGKYSFDFDIVYYITTRNYTTYLIAKQEINFSILKLLQSKKMHIPYPTQSVIVENITS